MIRPQHKGDHFVDVTEMVAPFSWRHENGSLFNPQFPKLFFSRPGQAVTLQAAVGLFGDGVFNEPGFKGRVQVVGAKSRPVFDPKHFSKFVR